MKQVILENDFISAIQVQYYHIVVCKYYNSSHDIIINKLSKVYGTQHQKYHWLSLKESDTYSSFKETSSGYDGYNTIFEAIKTAIEFCQKHYEKHRFEILVFDSIKEFGQWLIKQDV